MPASEERCLAERGVAERAFEDCYGVAATNPACVWRGEGGGRAQPVVATKVSV